MNLSQDQIRAAIAEALKSPVDTLSQLSGGASQETWYFRLVDGEEYILRRPPSGQTSDMDQRTIGPEKEVGILRELIKYTPQVPEVRYLFKNNEVLFPGYIMRFCAGETLATKILRSENFHSIRPRLAAQCGQVLAAIHAAPREALPALAVSDAPTEIKRYSELLAAHGHPHPVFELTLNWLKKNVPGDRPITLVHGDFRNGNLIVDPEQGLRAVIDWELSHFGDPMEDLGWICVSSWRFGQIDQPVGGFGNREDLYAAYEEAGGHVDREVARFWEILGTLKWGIMCLIMYGIYESGVDRSVERAAIGRRASETEIDLLRLLAGDE